MTKPQKKRIDQLLHEKGLVESRSQAQALILAGKVLANEERIDKPGQKVLETAHLRIKDQMKYVSRGGLKLEKALQEFSVSVENKIGLDIGASTGGFTDCLLQNGAQKIYAIDAGHNQLHWRLQNDARVISFEKTNFRYFDLSLIVDSIDFAVMDVSFISITKLLPKVKEIFSLTQNQKFIVFLIKPQFEVGKNQVGKGGLVQDESLKKETVEKIKTALESFGFKNSQVIPSPIRGATGNEEFLIHATYS